jgi:GNAT superfamily N-acetyltransferase
MTFPDINQVLRRMNGRLLPSGWYHYLRKGRIMTWIRIGFLGVKPEYQHTGVAAKLYIEHFETARRRPQKDGHCGWILETNWPMNRAMEAMGSHIAKRYRMYERVLESAAASADGGAQPGTG